MAVGFLSVGNKMSQSVVSTFKTQCMDCINQYWGNDPIEIKRGYECLYREITPFVKGLFRNLQTDQQVDVIHDALLKIHKADRATVIDSCSSWVKTIARREGISLYRKEKRHKENRAEEEQLEYEQSEGASVSDDFEKQLQLQENIEKTIEFLKNESGGEHDLEIMTGLVNGDSHEEIAKKIGRSASAVSTRASVIRKKLQALKSDYYE